MHKVLILIGFLTVTACSGGSSATADAVSDTGLVSCVHDPRVTPYQDGWKAFSADKSVQVTLLSADPKPPIHGTNHWHVRISDEKGKDLLDLPVDVSPFMPDHGHPASVLPTMTTQTDGSWNVEPLELFMAGVWRVTFHVHVGAIVQDVEFVLCVEG